MPRKHPSGNASVQSKRRRRADAERSVARILDAAVEALASDEPDRGDPAEALQRVLTTAWQELGRFHALVAINTRRPQAELRRLHRPVLALLQPLIERGQRAGTFRSDVPTAWHLSMLLALIHAASGELQTNRLPAAEIESALVKTVLGALSSEGV